MPVLAAPLSLAAAATSQLTPPPQPISEPRWLAALYLLAILFFLESPPSFNVYKLRHRHPLSIFGFPPNRSHILYKKSVTKEASSNGHVPFLTISYKV